MLKKIHKITFSIELLSGMHIGGSSENYDIGGADSNVIKNPITKEPYIPGSSFKGKLRSLLEYRFGQIQSNCLKVSDNNILNLFQAVNYDNRYQGTRAIFRDLLLTDDSSAALQKELGNNIFTEVKAENQIDRIKGTAIHPRFIERVPAGAVFQGEIILHVYEGDDENELIKYLNEGLSMLENNFIGGSGSRGYGRVKMCNLEWMPVTF